MAINNHKTTKDAASSKVQDNGTNRQTEQKR
jgi:hypothetical protein